MSGCFSRFWILGCRRIVFMVSTSALGSSIQSLRTDITGEEKRMTRGKEGKGGRTDHLMLDGIGLSRALATILTSPPAWVANSCCICSLGSAISKDEMLLISCGGER